MKPIIDFIKYHNSVSIGFALFMLASGAMAASPDVREVLYNTETTPKSADNSFLLNIDLDRSDFGLVILDIQEDEENYYVGYQYNTVKVQEYSWRPTSIQNSLIIAKSALGRQDLGEVVAHELGQLMDREYNYFKDAQKIERAKGPIKKVVTTKYAGLIGALLDPKDKVFEGYEPVVAPTVRPPQISTDELPITTDTATSSISENQPLISGNQLEQSDGVIYPQVSADYDDYLKNVAPNGESAQATTTDISINQPESALISVEATSSEPTVTENSTSTEVTFQHGATE